MLEQEKSVPQKQNGHNIKSHFLSNSKRVQRRIIEFTMTSASLLDKAIASRDHLFDSPHETAFRLFNGFTEGEPNLVLDVYGQTLLIHNYADAPGKIQELMREVIAVATKSLSWLRAGISKTRNGSTREEKNGVLVFGTEPNTKIRENGVWYALDLTMNRDASFYLDTRHMRKWLTENMRGMSVLNTFAHTGSFGVAALAGGANRVVHVDRNNKFLNLAKQSYALNNFPISKNDFLAQDFFPAIARLKNSKRLFDCVILDPPFFSSTSKGNVDQVNENARLINKVRPLVNDGGTLIAINNALFLSGKEYLRTLQKLCQDGYLKIRELIPVPEDFVGYHRTGLPITDPAPFNHSTKIAVLEVKRKKQESE
jgi:23S rRNA (cytosine1962-C5)-methyltransferase